MHPLWKIIVFGLLNASPVFARAETVCRPAGNERGHLCSRRSPPSLVSIVTFSCKAPSGLRLAGNVELGRYIRMGHYQIFSGTAVIAQPKSDGGYSREEFPIVAGDVQEESSIWFSAGNFGQPALNFELNFAGPSRIIFGDGISVDLNCALIRP